MISRRTFLSLSAAGLMGAYATSWPLAPAVPRTLFHALAGRPLVRIHSILLGDGPSLVPYVFTVDRIDPTGEAHRLLQVPLSQAAQFFWYAQPTCELLIPQGHTLQIEPGDATWSVVGSIWKEERNRYFSADSTGRLTFLDA